jgi:PTS system fructose-specific IIC component
MNKKKILHHLVYAIQRIIPFIVLFSVFHALEMFEDQSVFASLLFHLSDEVYLVIEMILLVLIIYSFSSYYFIVPALIIGFFNAYFGLGFLGAMTIGILMGLFIEWIWTQLNIKEQIKKLILLNIIVFLFFSLLGWFVFKPSILFVLDAVIHLIGSLPKDNIYLISAVLALFITVEGGAFNKIAFGFLIEMVHKGGYEHIIAPALVAMTIPPLAIAVSMTVFPSRFNKSDKTQLRLNYFSSLVGLTEASLGVTLRRPLYLIPMIVFSSVIASLSAAFFGLENNNLFVSVIALVSISNIPLWLLAHLIGVLTFLILTYFFLPKSTNKKIKLK